MTDDLSNRRVLERLKKREDFKRVQKHDFSAARYGVVLQARPNELSCARVGFTVSTRVDKRAVQRNRLKRRLKAACNEILQAEAKNGYDYVFSGRRAGKTSSFEDLKKDIRACLKKLCLIRHKAQSDTSKRDAPGSDKR